MIFAIRYIALNHSQKYTKVLFMCIHRAIYQIRMKVYNVLNTAYSHNIKDKIALLQPHTIWLWIFIISTVIFCAHSGLIKYVGDDMIVTGGGSVDCPPNAYCNVTGGGSIRGNNNTKLFITAGSLRRNTITCPPYSESGDAICSVTVQGVGRTPSPHWASPLHWTHFMSMNSFNGLKLTCIDPPCFRSTDATKPSIFCGLDYNHVCEIEPVDYSAAVWNEWKCVDGGDSVCTDYSVPTHEPTTSPTTEPTTFSPTHSPTKYSPLDGPPRTLYVSESNGCDFGQCDSNDFNINDGNYCQSETFQQSQCCTDYMPTTTTTTNKSSTMCNANNTVMINDYEIYNNSVIANVYNSCLTTVPWCGAPGTSCGGSRDGRRYAHYGSAYVYEDPCAGWYGGCRPKRWAERTNYRTIGGKTC